MLIECSGFRKDKYFIPPFILEKGDIIVLNLLGGAHFYELSMFLAHIFSGQIKEDNVTVNQPLKFVEHFIESAFRRLFFPVTIGEYIKKNAGADKRTAEKVFNLGWLDSKTHVNSLAGNPGKILSLYTTLSNTKNIVFDLVGVDPQGAQSVYDIVKANVEDGGAAILLDNFGDFRYDCTKFIQIEVKDL
jgi:hypothetical protein